MASLANKTLVAPLKMTHQESLSIYSICWPVILQTENSTYFTGKDKEYLLVDNTHCVKTIPTLFSMKTRHEQGELMANAGHSTFDGER